MFTVWATTGCLICFSRWVCHCFTVWKQCSNRFEMLKHSKTDSAKKKKIQWKYQHRGNNQEKRKKWGQSQKAQHSHGDEDDEEPFVSTPTRTTRKREKSMESDDKCALSSSDEDVGSTFSIEVCTCVGCARSCPLNPRNKGAFPSSSATTEFTPILGTCSSKTECGSDSPCALQSQIVYSAAAGTTSECCTSSPH